MDPKFVVYDLKDDLNVERFLKLAAKEDYCFGKRRNLPDPCPFKYGIIFAKNGSAIQASLHANMLYVHSDFEGKIWNLDDLAKDFKLE